MGLAARHSGGIGGALAAMILAVVLGILAAGALPGSETPPLASGLADAVVAQEAEDTTFVETAQTRALDAEMTLVHPASTAPSVTIPLGKRGDVPADIWAGQQHWGKHNAGTFPADKIAALVTFCLQEYRKGNTTPRDPDSGEPVKLSVYQSLKLQKIMLKVEKGQVCGAIVLSLYDMYRSNTCFGGSECGLSSCQYWQGIQIRDDYRIVMMIGR